MSLEAVQDALHDFVRRELVDPRIGSGLDGNKSLSALQSPTQPVNSSSYRAVFTSFGPIAGYSVVCLAIFWVLRRRYERVYVPRSFLSSLEPEERSPKLPTTWFNWVKTYYQIPDAEVLNRSSLDGFLFLRYLKLLCTICGFGCLLTWPTLLPIHHYGGMGQSELNALTFGNVRDVKWSFVHAAEAWIFFSFVLYLLNRECLYFINLRQAYVLSPYYANRLSSRTVLFSCVPTEILTERKIRRIFGDTVKSVWIPRECEDLDRLVDEREQTAIRLEKAEIELIRKANVAYRKALKSGQPPEPQRSESSVDDKPPQIDISVISHGSSPPLSPSISSSASPQPNGAILATSTFYGASGPPPGINGSVAAQWIPADQRPRHRPLANYGRRVDTIKWTRNRLKVLAPKIAKLRREYRKGHGKAIPAVFIEFHSQVDAQSAYQTLAHHRANHMEPEIIGVRPHEIIWPSLYMNWWERIVRRFAIQAFIGVLIVFWALPAGFIGLISNIKAAAKKFKFLAWVNQLPAPVLGLISGLLPAVALVWLMAMVPMILRFCARQAGVTTKSRIELFVHNSYFIFQVVQVFLITTVASAASDVLEDLIKNPLSARDLLAASLPKASNFYISYFLLQGFALSATRIAHLGGLFRHVLMSNIGGPRLISRRYHRLRKIHWGSVYPVFTNMGVIAISYTIIAPIVLGVAFIAFCLLYQAFRYNLLYIYSSERDTRGLHYPRALKQTLTGVYLAEVVLVGLFVVKGAYFPMIFMIALIVFTYLVHFSMDKSFSPLLHNLPRTLVAEEELRKAGNHPWNTENLVDKDDGLDPQEGVESQNNVGYDSDFDPSEEPTVSHGEQTSRAVEGADTALDIGRDTVSKFISKKYEASPLPSMVRAIDFWTYWISPKPSKKPNLVLKFLHPEIFADYHVLRSQIPEDIADLEIKYEESVLKDAYSPPSMRNKSPRIWLPRDTAGVSRQEVDHCSKVIECSDSDAWLGEKGLVDVDLDGETERWALRDWERVRF